MDDKIIQHYVQGKGTKMTVYLKSNNDRKEHLVTASVCQESFNAALNS